MAAGHRHNPNGPPGMKSGLESFRVQSSGLRFRVQGLGFRLGFKLGARFRVKALGFRSPKPL